MNDRQKVVAIINRRKFILGGLAGMGILSAGGYSFVNSKAFGHKPAGGRQIGRAHV